MVEFVSSKKNDIIADQFCYLLANIFLDPFLEPQKPAVGNTTDNEELKNRTLVITIILEEYP
jgi:hypothetical protein